MEEPCRSDEKGETEKGLFVGDNRLQTNEASGSSDALIGKEDTTPSSERRNIYGNDPGETEQRGNRSRNNNNDGTRPADAAFPEGEEDGMLEGELIVQYSMDSDIGGLVAAPSLQNYHNKDSSTGSRTMTEGAPKVHHDLRYDDMDDAAAGVGEFRQKSHPATSDQQHEMEGGNSVIGSQRRQVAAPMQEETPVNEGKVHPGTEESTGTPTAAPSSLRPEVLQQRSTSEETAASPRPQPQQQHGVQTKGRFQFQPQSHAPDVVDEIKGVPGSSSSSTRSTTSSQHHSFLSIDSNHEQQQHQHTTPPLHHHSKRSQQQHQVNNTTLKGQPPIVSRHYSLPLTTGNSGTDETIPPAETIPALGTAPPIAGTATSSQPDSASNGQVVTKKKGRFNFLEVTPATSSTTTSRSASPGRTVEPPPETSEYQQRHERSFSASSAPTGSLTPPNLAGKAFDGSGSLVVRKKGRFVVTSVPVSSSTQQQQQIGASTTESQMSAPPNRPRESTADTQQSHYAQTTVQSAPIMNSGQLQIQASNSWNDGIATPILLDHSMSQSSTNNGVGGNGTSLSVLYINNLQSPGSMIDLNSAETHAAATQQHFTCAADDGSAVPISTANTTTTLQPRATATPRPVPVTSRSSTTSGLAAQHQGFGKMLYFLDQMKVEVSDADKSIKSLQTDTKFLKEKNKELEAKARDMERKWNQEKALREVAETRVRALKKKLKAMESQYADADMIKEDDSVATHQTSGVHSRANSLDNAIVGLDVGGSQNANMSLTNAEVTKPRAPPILHDSYGVLDTIDGSLNPVNLVRTASFVRPSADGSPPRESATRKATSQQSPMATSSQSFKETAGTPGISKDNFLPMNDAPKTTIQGDPLVQHSQPLSGPVSANMGPPPRHKSRHDISASVSSFILPIAVEFDSGRAQEQHSEPVSAESINSVEDGYRDFPYGVGSQLSEESSSDLMSFSIAPQRSTSADSSTTTSLFPIIRQQQVSMPYQDNPLPSSDPVFVESQQNVLPNLNLQVPLEPHPPNLFAEEEGAGLTDPFDDLIQQWRPSDGRQ